MIFDQAHVKHVDKWGTRELNTAKFIGWSMAAVLIPLANIKSWEKGKVAM